MLNEEGLELMTVDMLKELGYEYEPGESIDRDYSEVILEPNLTMSLYKLNRNLNPFHSKKYKDVPHTTTSLEYNLRDL